MINNRLKAIGFRHKASHLLSFNGCHNAQRNEAWCNSQNLSLFLSCFWHVNLIRKICLQVHVCFEYYLSPLNPQNELHNGNNQWMKYAGSACTFPVYNQCQQMRKEKPLLPTVACNLGHIVATISNQI